MVLTANDVAVSLMADGSLRRSTTFFFDFPLVMPPVKPWACAKEAVSAMLSKQADGAAKYNLKYRVARIYDSAVGDRDGPHPD